MMKSLAGLAAAALLSAGLATAPAQATPYPPTVKTSVNIKVSPSKIKVLVKARMIVTVKASGTAAPKSGKISIKFQRKVGATWRAVTYKEKNRLAASRKYRGKAAPITIGWFKKPGTYRAVVRFVPKAGTVFKPTSKNLVLRVTK